MLMSYIKFPETYIFAPESRDGWKMICLFLLVAKGVFSVYFFAVGF